MTIIVIFSLVTQSSLHPCSTRVTWELVRNADSQAGSQTCWVRICITYLDPRPSAFTLKLDSLQTQKVEGEGLIGVGAVVTLLGQKLDFVLTEPSYS